MPNMRARTAIRRSLARRAFRSHPKKAEIFNRPSAIDWPILSRGVSKTRGRRRVPSGTTPRARIARCESRRTSVRDWILSPRGAIVATSRDWRTRLFVAAAKVSHASSIARVRGAQATACERNPSNARRRTGARRIIPRSFAASVAAAISFGVISQRRNAASFKSDSPSSLARDARSST